MYIYEYKEENGIYDFNISNKKPHNWIVILFFKSIVYFNFQQWKCLMYVCFYTIH